MKIPTDPIILLSVINTKLRDFYSSFDRLCDGEDISCDEKEIIIGKLNSVGYAYSESRNQFV